MKQYLLTFVFVVAPHTGAWIETRLRHSKFPPTIVAPHTGAWIETFEYKIDPETGLVAPHTGAWIETTTTGKYRNQFLGRTPYGCVD